MCYKLEFDHNGFLLGDPKIWTEIICDPKRMNKQFEHRLEAIQSLLHKAAELCEDYIEAPLNVNAEVWKQSTRAKRAFKKIKKLQSKLR